MKTEMQQLEENTKRELATQKLTELTQYMDTLMLGLREAVYAAQRSTRLEIAALAVWVLTLFIGTDLISEVAWLLWLFTLLRSWIFIMPKLTKYDSELDGVFRTLDILGMIEHDKHNKRQQRRKKRFANPYAGLVAKWERIKSKMRTEAYA